MKFIVTNNDLAILKEYNPIPVKRIFNQINNACNWKDWEIIPTGCQEGIYGIDFVIYPIKIDLRNFNRIYNLTRKKDHCVKTIWQQPGINPQDRFRIDLCEVNLYPLTSERIIKKVWKEKDNPTRKNIPMEYMVNLI